MISPIFWVFLVLVIVIVGALMLRKKECKLYKEDGKCVDECKNKIWDFTTQSCVESCPSGTFEYDAEAGWKQCNKKKIIDCPVDKVTKFTTDGIECVNECSSNDIVYNDDGKRVCFEKCNGYFHPITYKCLDSCSGEFPYKTTIIDSDGRNFNMCSETKQQ